MTPMAIELPSTIRNDYVDTDELRTLFALAMSAMYKKEVPLYGNLMSIVHATNEEILANSNDSRIASLKSGDVAAERLDLERHGAIRLGTPYELQTVRRIFETIGMHPVGYYDLSQAGLPMHATCFRPTTTSALKKNPFRVFTTLLRPNLLKDIEARNIALKLLARRNIFSKQLLRLLDTADSQGGRLTPSQGTLFVQEAMETFGWRPEAAASMTEYQRLKEQHPVLADIACFQSSHINHLTPRTLDISAAQKSMKAEGLAVKERIEGPPQRDCPILLRQTSFLALEEQIEFPSRDGEMVSGLHKARFGEIEERGAAVTPAGRRLYDSLLHKTMVEISKKPHLNPAEQDCVLAETFQHYPDNWDELRQRGLVYFYYRCSPGAGRHRFQDGSSREELVALGVLETVPITYEDFLPLSAAGIFQSNLGKSNNLSATISNPFSDKMGYELALGGSIIDLDSSYSEAQDASLRACALELGLREYSLID